MCEADRHQAPEELSVVNGTNPSRMHVRTEVYLHLFVQRPNLSILEEVRVPEAQRSAAVEIDGVRHDWDDDGRRKKDLRAGWGVINCRRDGL